ncbi:DNA topoisomerase-1 [Rhizobium sp. RU20A]|uniref:DNA topoisomerase IB n=1 Tax=Rhizobium sp. RU20A TaxID=1907412 RepID=UPI000956D01B|nr:DNA topoisomerase IB [Rhizobium sp. RU20A]SIR45661.1 DNA topoisomerase-1 [Rhizobium sp. RU20A]
MQAVMVDGLVYVSDTEPGIRRHRRGTGFSYRMPDGKAVSDATIRKRIAALGLPPAYEKVWICLDERGHLQATGYDQRGRKQYRYHRDWQAARSLDKFGQLVAFGEVLPGLRRRVRKLLDGEPGQIETTLAALLTLLDEEHLRVGNAAYAAENRTYGATTLLKKHLRLGDGFVGLSFVAKGGKRVRRILKNPRLHRLLEATADLPGRHLFAWRDEAGFVHPVDSGRLNAFLAEQTGLGISAKTFRTWGGSVAAFSEARRIIAAGDRPSVKAISEAAAEVLHNTPAISRSSYIHPGILSLADRAVFNDALAEQVLKANVRGDLRADEGRMLDFLARSG